MAGRRQSRWQRQAARRRFEEITAWIVLPLVILIGWWIGSQFWAALSASSLDWFQASR